MLWYGYIYYILVFILTFVMFSIFLRFSTLTSRSTFRLYTTTTLILLSVITFLAVDTLVSTYAVLESFLYLPFLSTNSNYQLDSNFTSVYYFPFLYIFILITFISIYYCLSYNKDELTSFTLFCTIILLAGYMLFYTDSLILFFMAYEMLLVPSFFILYKFAKTRRSVEAAYLMFF